MQQRKAGKLAAAVILFGIAIVSMVYLFRPKKEDAPVPETGTIAADTAAPEQSIEVLPDVLDSTENEQSDNRTNEQTDGQVISFPESELKDIDFEAGGEQYNELEPWEYDVRIYFTDFEPIEAYLRFNEQDALVQETQHFLNAFRKEEIDRIQNLRVMAETIETTWTADNEPFLLTFQCESMDVSGYFLTVKAEVSNDRGWRGVGYDFVLDWI